MKIAVIGTHGYPYVYGGYETFAKELSEELVLRGIGVTIYCRKNNFESFPTMLNGINLVYIWTIDRKSLAQFVHSFLSMIHACFSGFDILLVVNSANGPFGLIAKVFRTKTIINVDGLEWLRPKWEGFASKYFLVSSKLATKLYDAIVTDSEEMRKIYKDKFRTESTVIAYGASIRYSVKPQLIKRWSLVKREYYLIVGRLIADNNAAVITGEFLKSKSRKKLVIVGDVPYKDKYAEQFKYIDDERIVLTGYVNNQDELAELYLNCFIYVHGHQFGGTNPSMLNALGCGCAILALDTVFNREMLDNGKYGKFFTKNENELKTTMEEVEKHPQRLKKYRHNSRERITSKYTWERVTNQYVYLFNLLIGGQGESSNTRVTKW